MFCSCFRCLSKGKFTTRFKAYGRVCSLVGTLLQCQRETKRSPGISRFPSSQTIFGADSGLPPSPSMAHESDMFILKIGGARLAIPRLFHARSSWSGRSSTCGPCSGQSEARGFRANLGIGRGFCFLFKHNFSLSPLAFEGFHHWKGIYFFQWTFRGWVALHPTKVLLSGPLFFSGLGT